MFPFDRWAEESAATAATERLRRRQLDRPLRRAEAGLQARRIYPSRHYGWIEPCAPGGDVAFLTVANDRFFRGLEAMLLSLVDIYPDLASPVYIIHDGTLIPFLQRRLLSIYSQLIFETPQPSWWNQPLGNSSNQKRIGGLGYLNTHALHLRGFRRVIVLDSDLLIEGAIDPLWAEGDAFRAIADCGETAYAVVSQKTGKPVVNSGVMSVPGDFLTGENELIMESLILSCQQPFCPLLDPFADQKVWNQFLANHPLELLPINFNCNVKYLGNHLNGFSEGISVVHFAGSKPWLEPPWLESSANPRPATGVRSVTDHAHWNRYYRHLLYRHRLKQYQSMVFEPLPHLKSSSDIYISSDPSSLLHCVHSGGLINIVIGDPACLGQNWADQTHLPPHWRESLTELVSRSTVVLWASLELRPLLDHLELPLGVMRRYVLVEFPFSPKADQGLDLVASHPTGYEPIYSCPDLSITLALIRALASAA